MINAILKILDEYPGLKRDASYNRKSYDCNIEIQLETGLNESYLLLIGGEVINKLTIYEDGSIFYCSDTCNEGDMIEFSEGDIVKVLSVTVVDEWELDKRINLDDMYSKLSRK